MAGSEHATAGLTRVTLAPADIAGALVLSAGAGWNQTAEDWALFIARGRTFGCRDGTGRLVATAAALAYGGGAGWLSMVLVAPDWRHRGLASALMAAGIEHLRAAQVTPVLDATPAGQPVYRQLGFACGFAFERWEGPGGASAVDPDASEAGARSDRADRAAGSDVRRHRAAGSDVRPERAEPRVDRAAVRAADDASGDDLATVRRVTVDDLEALVALDANATGVDRRVLLDDLLQRPGTQAWMTRDGSGFVMLRHGRRAWQLGPLTARDPAAAGSLLATALAHADGRVFLDVPHGRRKIASALAAAGFERQRPFMRMALGSDRPLTCGVHQFVLAGPEYG